MYISVVNDYTRLADEGRVDPKYVNCPFCRLTLVGFVEPDAIVLRCALCSYSKDLGYGEYLSWKAQVDYFSYGQD